jgi:hypothetical protein
MTGYIPSISHEGLTRHMASTSDGAFFLYLGGGMQT